MNEFPDEYTRNQSALWFQLPQSSIEAERRLFCFPYAGGAASLFFDWPKQFTQSTQVCPVELPGRGRRIRETPYRRIAPLVHSLFEGLLPYLDKPFVLFGHSVGALIAFEFCRIIHQQTQQIPLALFVSGSRPPQSWRTTKKNV
jgi:medium-chain acyl-[acyl-carrier-protein] hydrolase